MCPYFSPDEGGLTQTISVYVEEKRQNMAEKGGGGQHVEKS